MTLKNSMMAAALLAATATPAVLAGNDAKFDGLYGGIEAGVDWTKLRGDTGRDRSLYYGGLLGYRVQTGSDLVYGFEGTFGDNGYTDETLGRHIGTEYSGSFMLGTAFGQDKANLLYTKLGYVRARVHETGEDGNRYTEEGWRIGGGYERAINTNVSLRFGLDYTRYGEDENQIQGKAGLLVKF
ncbi:MAG: outer membrane beta-barrel protein [Kordiimonadaceae bacterium]|nr:outer membrane beta-barrel protein [Kordiimonadaceae bacterium]